MLHSPHCRLIPGWYTDSRMIRLSQDDMHLYTQYLVYPSTGLSQESGVHTRFWMGVNGAPSGKLLGCVQPRMIRICIHCPKHRYVCWACSRRMHSPQDNMHPYKCNKYFTWARIPRLLTTEYRTKNAGNEDRLYSWGFKGNKQPTQDHNRNSTSISVSI